MNNRQVRINVLIITYKQEKLIGRALDSILCQKEYGLNKIVICDDCSPDKNWEVIQDYAEKYPEYIVAYQNDHNLGIYGNAEKLVSLKGDADLYYIMAGDDALCDGWFNAVQNFVISNDIDVAKRAVCIYSDWKIITPNKAESIIKQDKILLKGVDPQSVRMRLYVNARSMMQSKAVLDQYKPIDFKHGVPLAEKMFDIQPMLHSEQNYYCPYIGSVYFACIGVSAKAGEKEYRESVIEANKKWFDMYNWSPKDRQRIKYNIAYQEFCISPTFKRYLKMIWLYLSSLNMKIGVSFKEVLNLVFRPNR